VPLSIEQQIEALRDLYRSERDPDGRAFAPLADAYRRAGQVKQALALLREGLAELPDFTTGHVVAARVYMDSGLTAEAELSCRRALELDPENVLALETLAGALDARGADAEAREVRQRLEDIVTPHAAGEDRAEPLPSEGLDAPASTASAPAEREDSVQQEPASDAADEAEEVVDIDELLADDALVSQGVATDAVDEAEEVVDIDSLLAEVRTASETKPSRVEAEEDVVVDIEELLAEEPPIAETAPVGAEPEAEDVVDIDALLAEEPAVPEPGAADVRSEPEVVMGMEALLVEDLLGPRSPTTEPGVPDEVVAIETLLTEEPAGPMTEVAEDDAEAEDVVAIEALAAGDAPPPTGGPTEPAGVAEEAVDIDALAEPGQADDAPPAEDREEGLPVVTRTLAELFVAQGLTDRAIGVYRRLVSASPGDGQLQARLAELERVALAPRPEAGVEAGIADAGLDRSELDDDGAEHAWHVGAHEERHDVDTPFAWTEEEPDDKPAAPAISAYFDRLLAWDPSLLPGSTGRHDEPREGGAEEERRGEEG